MSVKAKIMTIFGTRPEAIKMATVVRELKNTEEIEPLVVVTAQHREMLDQVLSLFSIKPDYDLDIMQKEQTLADITCRVLQGLQDIYEKENPDMILVHGDTSTTFVGALASFYNHIKVGHVEAGLRTYNKYSPFPEEMNRHLTGVLADLHFAPTEKAARNLKNENILEDKIFITGNTVIDALLKTVDENYQFKLDELKKINFADKKVILLTAHRRENLGKPMQNIFAAVRQLIKEDKDLEVIFPVHLNPKVRRLADSFLKDIERIHLIEPLDYKPFANLMSSVDLVLTDSGGIQEEAPALGKPVLVLRDTTERPEAVKAGTVKKVGTDREKIYNLTKTLLNNDQEYNKMAQAVNPYGDGKASQRIKNRLLAEFEILDEAGDEFRPDNKGGDR
ncbi:MAG: non-hydrolyzing UDP-N-acetylglucosamine 2-epimerase [Halanaerobiales bacterium]